MVRGVLFWTLMIVLLIFFSSCTTFSSFYDPWHDVNELRGIITLEEGEEPRILRSGSNMDDDINEILSNNYIIIGTTSFNGPDDNITNSIKGQCKKNGATIALYGKDYTDTRHGVYTNYYGGVSSYNIRRYDYTIYYFVQRTFLPALGWRLNDLDNEDRRTFQRNTGAIVYVVLKNTSVFFANIVRNDIIIRINEHIINNVDDYWEIYDRLNIGDEIEVEYIRNNGNNIVKIKVE